MGGGGQQVYNSGDIGFQDPNAGSTAKIPVAAYGAVPWYAQVGQSIKNNPETVMRIAALGGSLVAPQAAPLFNAAATATEGYMRPQREKAYQGAYEKAEAIKDAKKTPGATPPTMSEEEKAALSRGAPRSSDRIALEGAQSARDFMVIQQERKRQQMAQLSNPMTKVQAGQMIQGQGRSPFSPPGGQGGKLSLAALAHQLVRRREGGSGFAES